MKVAFRVDSADYIGMGHIVRCLTLAEKLRINGAEVFFVTRNHRNNYNEKILEKNFALLLLPRLNIKINNENYSSWLGISQVEEANQILEALKDHLIDWMIIDHYGISSKCESILKKYIKNIMVIDDLVKEKHNCDVILNTNFFSDNFRLYEKLLPSKCTLLLGPKYALIRDEYSNTNKKRICNKTEFRILVFLGTDPENLITKILEALSVDALKHIYIDLVIGNNNPYERLLQQKANIRKRVIIYKSLPNLIELMRNSDLSIGAGGITLWERIYFSLPTILICTAENQKRMCITASNLGLVDYLGSSKLLNNTKLVKSVLKAVNKKNLSKNLDYLVDGKGAFRVAKMITKGEINPYSITLAKQDDAPIFFKWLDHKVVNHKSSSADKDSFHEYEKKLSNSINNESISIFILKYHDEPAGKISFKVKRNKAIINFLVNPKFSKLHLEQKLIELGCQIFSKDKTISFIAEVLSSNKKLCNIYRLLGFYEDSKTYAKKIIFKSEGFVI